VIPTPALEPVTLSDIANRCRNVRWHGDDRFTSSCPVHGGTDGDRHPSLDVKLGERCIVLVCRAGCDFGQIIAALGIEARQLFPPDVPWAPARPRHDPDRAAREWFEKLRTLNTPPPPNRYRQELVLVGNVLLDGTRNLGEWMDIDASHLRVFLLRVILQAMQELARQGTPRRWFSPHALAMEIDRVACVRGRAREMGVYRMCRWAAKIARRTAERNQP